MKHDTFKKLYMINSMLGVQLLINLIPDKTYLKLVYFMQSGKKLNIKKPETYNEKLQWLKIYDHNPLYTKLVDKYEVKEYVRNLIGDKYIIPTLGVWDAFENIDFNKLPNQFILKCTHNSGGSFICRSKESFNTRDIQRKINLLLKNNYFWYLREWQYKNIKPRVIAEEYISGEPGIGLLNYKFFCFNGDPKIVMIVHDQGSIQKANFYNINLELLPVKNLYTNFIETVSIPDNFNEMISVAKKLSKGFKHIRVDLYNIKGKIYFGELTLHNFGGISNFEPTEFDKQMGDWINI